MDDGLIFVSWLLELPDLNWKATFYVGFSFTILPLVLFALIRSIELDIVFLLSNFIEFPIAFIV